MLRCRWLSHPSRRMLSAISGPQKKTRASGADRDRMMWGRGTLQGVNTAAPRCVLMARIDWTPWLFMTSKCAGSVAARFHTSYVLRKGRKEGVIPASIWSMT